MIGVVGGMGSRASITFQSFILDASCAVLDADNPPLVTISRPDIPSRTKYLAGDGVTPVPCILEVIEALRCAGASVCALPCNTLHFLIDEIREGTSIPVLSMLEAVDSRIAVACAPGQRWRVMGTGPTMHGIADRQPLYDAILRRHSVTVEYLSDTQERALREVIDAVKSGSTNEEVAGRLSVLVAANLPTPQHRVLLACTELDALTLPDHDPARLFSAGRALAADCVAAYRNHLYAVSQRH